MEELQRHLRESSVDTKIASSLQKNIKEIVANDGQVHGANERLTAFAETQAGQQVLGMAFDLMRKMNLAYTEQVFIQESGHYPAKSGGSEKPNVIDDLVDIYERLERPITQTDGLVDDSDGICVINDTPPARRNKFACPKSPRTPARETPNTRFKRQFLEAFARGEVLDNSCSVSDDGGWESVNTSDEVSVVTVADSTMAPVRGAAAPQVSGVNAINWTRSGAGNNTLDESGWETTLGSTMEGSCELVEEVPRFSRSRSNKHQCVNTGECPSPQNRMSGGRRNTQTPVRRPLATGQSRSGSPERHDFIRRPGMRPRFRRSNSAESCGNGSFIDFMKALPYGRCSSMQEQGWEGFEIGNGANEQRFFNLNSTQISYLRKGLKIPPTQPVSPTVVQVGHSIVINAAVYVDERDTKQFSMGSLYPSCPPQSCKRSIPVQLTPVGRGTGGRSGLSGESVGGKSCRTPLAAGSAATPRAPMRIQPADRRVGPRGNERRLNFSESRTCTPCSPGSARSPRQAPNAPLRMGGLARGIVGNGNVRQLDFSEDEASGADCESKIYVADGPEHYIYDTMTSINDRGRPIAVVGPRPQGFYPDENEPCVMGPNNANLTPLDYDEYGPSEDYQVNILNGQ